MECSALFATIKPRPYTADNKVLLALYSTRVKSLKRTNLSRHSISFLTLNQIEEFE